MGKIRSIMPVWDRLGMLSGANNRCAAERKQTKTYGLVSSLYAVNRVGPLRWPTLLYQQTNPYRVVAYLEPTDGFCA